MPLRSKHTIELYTHLEVHPTILEKAAEAAADVVEVGDIDVDFAVVGTSHPHIVDGRFRFDRESLWELAHQIAGTATAPLLSENPGYVFPADDVARQVSKLLEEAGYGPPPRGYLSAAEA